jgi:hypothetical protein
MDRPQNVYRKITEGNLAVTHWEAAHCTNEMDMPQNVYTKITEGN